MSDNLILGRDAASIRAEMLSKRAALDPDIKLSESIEISFRVRDLIFERDNIGDILCFYPMMDEPDLHNLYEELLDEGKSLYFPVSGQEDMVFYGVLSLLDFEEGRYGIMEPKYRDRPFDNTSSGDIICIVPGVCFDTSCNRIGFGKGYYDRYLASCSGQVFKIGVCYSTCLFEGVLPAHSGDVPMDTVITG